jgi:hypothetical protein
MIDLPSISRPIFSRTASRHRASMRAFRKLGWIAALAMGGCLAGPAHAATQLFGAGGAGAGGGGISVRHFAALGTETDGALYYCDDCTKAIPCAGSGSGAFAFGYGGQWQCTAPVAQPFAISVGGTGSATASGARTNLGAAATVSCGAHQFANSLGASSSSCAQPASSDLSDSPWTNAANITSGTLPIARGGTNAGTAAAALTNLGATSTFWTTPGTTVTAAAFPPSGNTTCGGYFLPVQVVAAHAYTDVSTGDSNAAHHYDPICIYDSGGNLKADVGSGSAGVTLGASTGFIKWAFTQGSVTFQPGLYFFCAAADNVTGAEYWVSNNQILVYCTTSNGGTSTNGQCPATITPCTFGTNFNNTNYFPWMAMGP